MSALAMASKEGTMNKTTNTCLSKVSARAFWLSFPTYELCLARSIQKVVAFNENLHSSLISPEVTDIVEKMLYWTMSESILLCICAKTKDLCHGEGTFQPMLVAIPSFRQIIA